LTGSDQRSDVK